MSKSIVLFDMDGTLTEPRASIQENMIVAIVNLLESSEVGIVTGSDSDYVFQQCKSLFENKHIDKTKLHLYPCNGTKVFKWSIEAGSYEEVYSIGMIEELGQDAYNSILSSCLEYQACIATIHNLPYTGTFLHYRGSMLNWCPIGRSANLEQRSAWIKEDKSYKLREHFHRLLVRDINKACIQATVALGGSTSFDIYPTGWDKTYVTKHLVDYGMTFVGDKCTGTGNDKTLYDLLQPTDAYETKNPEMTIELINSIIKKALA
jgi:phosphomannomutase|tara:strand:- start:109 stop:894 length:786 start_codon:yes stop_codon:yes gene_type:complete